MALSNRDKSDIAALITALDELRGPQPASSIYCAFECDHGRYERVTYLCAVGGFVEKTSSTVEITPKGIALARELNLALARA